MDVMMRKSRLYVLVIGSWHYVPSKCLFIIYCVGDSVRDTFSSRNERHIIFRDPSDNVRKSFVQPLQWKFTRTKKKWKLPLFFSFRFGSIVLSFLLSSVTYSLYTRLYMPCWYPTCQAYEPISCNRDD